MLKYTSYVTWGNHASSNLWQFRNNFTGLQTCVVYTYIYKPWPISQIDVQVQLFHAFGLFDHPIFFCTLHSSAPYLLLHLKRFSTGKTFALGLWVGCAMATRPRHASWAAFVTVYTLARLQTAKMAITYWCISTYHAIRLNSTLSYQETDLCCITAFAGSYNYH